MAYQDCSGQEVSLAASVVSGPYRVGRTKEGVSIICDFAVADAVGTLAIKNGYDVTRLTTIAFPDAAGTTQETLAITSGLNATAFEFVIPDYVSGELWLDYTRTGGGAADTMTVRLESRA